MMVRISVADIGHRPTLYWTNHSYKAPGRGYNTSTWYPYLRGTVQPATFSKGTLVLAHLSQRLEWAIVIAHRPSSVFPSVNFSHFRLLLWNRWTEFIETWQEAKSQPPLLSLCFSGRSEKQDGRPGLWLGETFSTSPLKPLKGIQLN